MSVLWSYSVVHIEPVDEHNVAHCVRLGQELVALGSFGKDGPEFDWNVAFNNTYRSMHDANYYIHIAVDDNGEYCGFVGGHLVEFFFSRKVMGIEDAWFVREGTPGRTKIAVRLMRGFIAWCLDERGALFVQTGDIAKIDSLAVDALYKHLGFTWFGTNYKYERRS
jgi:hypothetical protein